MDEIEPKFGDWLRGVYASERNPIRDGIYVRTTRRNHETLYELTDGKGKFWMYPKRSTERLNRPNAFDAAALRRAAVGEAGHAAFWREAFRARVEEQSLLAGHPIAAAKIHADTAVRLVEASIGVAMLAAAPGRE